MLRPSAGVAAVTACSVLLLAGFEHARRPAHARSVVAAQELWRQRHVRQLVAALTAMELLLGGAGLAVVLSVRSALSLAAVSMSLAYAAFGAYGLVLLRWRPQAPCGCSTGPRPVSALTVGRSMVLVGLALLALGLDRPILAGGSFEAAVTLLAGGGFGLLLWHLPDAVAEPEAVRR